jgi:hypothetical protein
MSNPRFFSVPEKPMDPKEVNEKIEAMIQKRNELYSPAGAVGMTGATGPASFLKGAHVQLADNQYAIIPVVVDNKISKASSQSR